LAARRTELLSHRVVVLAGGSSAEREVSLRSGNAVAGAASGQGYVTQFASVPASSPLALTEPPLPAGLPTGGAAPEMQPLPLVVLEAAAHAQRVPVVLTTLHGADGENGTWQGLLELLNVPYVSAGVRGSAVAMDKLLTKRLCAQMGIPTPPWWIERRGKSCRASVPPDVTDLVAKPVAEGSSVGVRMVTNDDAGWAEVAALSRRFDPLLIEQRIEGRELTQAVIGHWYEPAVLPLIEIKPREGFYDYDNKYTAGASEYVCPAAVDAAAADRISAGALTLYAELDLDPMARFDVILDRSGTPWFLEVNTLPGFTETSLLPKAARAAGVEFGELLEMLMLCALERWESKQGTPA
jgi:D-alanine-D-alanine ligase